MQKREKMVARIWVEGMSPVMAARWLIVSRMSWAMRSPVRLASRLSMTRSTEVDAAVSACICRVFVTSMPSLPVAYSALAMSVRMLFRLVLLSWRSIPSPVLLEA